MNKDLQKRRGIDKEKKKATQKKYMKKFKQYNVLLNREKDADIIEWLNGQSNKQKSIRDIIREGMTEALCV